LTTTLAFRTGSTSRFSSRDPLRTPDAAYYPYPQRPDNKAADGRGELYGMTKVGQVEGVSSFVEMMRSVPTQACKTEPPDNRKTGA
jgi:hypothetical protein